MPKDVGRWRASAVAVARAQSALRVGGWSMTLAGLAYAGLWAFAPLGFANVASVVVVASAMLITMGYAWRTLLACRSKRTTASIHNSKSQRSQTDGAKARSRPNRGDLSPKELVMTLKSWIAGGVALLAVALPAHAQVKVVGDWHGVLQSPVGPFTLIVTISEGEKGELRGEMASPDQGPGKMPLTIVSATAGHLAFTVKAAQIWYEGEWVEAEQSWSGVFAQGAKIPLTLRRGLPPARSVVEGLDGLWQGVVTRNDVKLRLVLRVATSERGTIVTFDSPDLGAVGLPVAGFSRRAQDVGFSVPASGARFSGKLSDDGTTHSGHMDSAGPAGGRTRVRSHSSHGRT